jgi:hypothetical protein
MITACLPAASLGRLSAIGRGIEMPRDRSVDVNCDGFARNLDKV